MDEKLNSEKWKESLGSVLNQYKSPTKIEEMTSSSLQLKKMSDDDESDDDVDFRAQAEPEFVKPKTPPPQPVAQKAPAHYPTAQKAPAHKSPAGQYGGKCPRSEYATVPDDEDEMFDNGDSQGDDHMDDDASMFDLTDEDVRTFMNTTFPEWKAAIRAQCEKEIPPKENVEEDEEPDAETMFVIFRRVFLRVLFESQVETLDGVESADDPAVISAFARNALLDFVNAVPEEAPFATMCSNILQRLEALETDGDLTVSSVMISKDTFSYPESVRSACVVTGRIIEVGAPCYVASFSAGSTAFHYAWKSGDYDGYVKTKFKMIGACLGVLDYIVNCVEEFKRENIDKTSERMKKMALISGEGTKFIGQKFFDWYVLIKKN